MERLANVISCLLLLTAACLVPASAGAQTFSQGTNFYLAVGNNISGNNNIEVKISASSATSGTITSGQGLSINYTAGPGTPYSTIISAAHVITSGGVVESNRWVRITSVAPVTVYAGSADLGGADAVSVIPVANNGTDYRVTNYYNLNPNQVTIVGTAAGTTVTITPFCNGAAGAAINVTLNQGQTYMHSGSCDITGTRVQSSQPVQVFSTCPCTQVTTSNSYCDFIWSSVLPVSRWGTTYAVAPTAGRNGTDMYRVITNTNNTIVYVNGVSQGTINPGAGLTLTLAGGNVITGSQPIHVTQFARSNALSGGNGDPAMIQLFPTTMFSQSYRFPTMLHTQVSSHYLTVVSRTGGAASVRLNGAPMSFTAIGATGWSHASSVVSAGEHTLTGDSLLHGILAGWGGVNSYGTAIGAMIPNVVLPIGEVRLHGEATGGGNLLQWECPSDLLGGHFDLQRALEVSNPEVIATHATPGPLRHLDADVLPGQTWLYRLRHHGPDGETTASDWVAIQATASPEAISVSPNPAADDIMLHLGFAPGASLRIRILDAQGRAVRSFEANLPAGSRSLQLDRACQDLAPGLYTLEAQSGAERHSTKFIHQ